MFIANLHKVYLPFPGGNKYEAVIFSLKVLYRLLVYLLAL